MEQEILERGYVTPNDKGIMAETDSASIQNAVDAALSAGLGRVVIPRYNARSGKMRWDVDEAVILDSGIEVILDNCHIRQTDGSMDNIFRNFREGEMRRTLAEEQHDIILRGIGNAVLDGGVANGLTEKNSLKEGRPHIYRNNPIYFHNLRDFRLENFTILNQRHWAIHLIYAENGYIGGLNLVCGNDRRNQDGLDLRVGCNNIIVENLRGQSGDDFIALSGFMGKRIQETATVEGKSDDIHDIQIRNISATAAECTLIALRCQDGVKIHDISIDGVHDVMSSKAAAEEGSFVFHFDGNRYPFPKSPYALLRVGQEGWITKKVCAPGDVYNLHVTNLHARCNNAVILNLDIQNSYFGNIYAGNDVDCVISTGSDVHTYPYGINMRDVTIENIFYDCRENALATAFDFKENGRHHRLENVEIRNAYLGNCPRVLNMEHEGTIRLSGIHRENAEEKITVNGGGTVILEGKTLA